MNNQVQSKNNLDLDFEKLIEQFPLSKKKLDEITPDELSKTVKWYEDLVSKLQQAFENAARSSKDEDKEKIRELYIEFSQMGFKKWKEYITNKIRSGEISHKDFSDAVKEYENFGFELQKILEYAARNSKGEDKDKIWKLYMEFSQKNVVKIVERLRKLGFALKNDKNLVDDLSRQSFRILEKTRHAQRSEVQYLITRIFAANKIKIPYLLPQVFNPSYSDELFKTFIYSFLGGVLSNKQNGGEEQ